MAEQQSHDAWEQIRKIHSDYKTFYQGSGRVLLVVLGILVVKAIFQNDGDFIKNLSMEILSIAATVLVLDWLSERREQHREEKALKERLVMEAGSQSNETAKRAIHELERHGWLHGEKGLLKEANLFSANLQGAELVGANLRGANLWGANLQGTNLALADLEDAFLLDANMKGARLRFANLQGANLLGVEFDENVMLPSRIFWTSNTDMTSFTDPNHPQFWRSDNPNSPAYRGKQDSAS